MVDLSWEAAALEALGALRAADPLRVEGRGSGLGRGCGVEGRALVGGMDEVGRGCLAGPVYVGVCVIDADCMDRIPQGLADSKALTAKRRQALVPQIQQWVLDWAIGEASNTEIDELGIMSALTLAGGRALTQLDARAHLPARLLLDGNLNYLRPSRPPDLFGSVGPGTYPEAEVEVETLVKGDAKSATVAAAACLAKVLRDEFMANLDDPGYSWASNAGYGTVAHREAIARLGASPWHRQSWKLL